ncbi:Glutamine synthetase type I [Liberibacter crescens BT-1]|uniref:Glutamine synthetase I beta n=1 Tax=Liberibacter crescens (strain BT-1) TaxID=1215343 RepID=L0EVE8_LIBCB|nr:type I glutamate--ammonia ligase [Liberibacter crescens]AGA64371.1 Glutamine synthetase type I [Liberibacter crescens BT-1]AMC12563.1 glutamine synthetase [Liberibacter crescens]
MTYSASDLINQIKENDVKFLDLRFTDMKGKFHHITLDTSIIDEELLCNGIVFDASSILGWKDINQSDMLLKPDIKTKHLDPFFAQSTMGIICDVYDPSSNTPYNRDPRYIAKKAEDYLKNTGIGDVFFVGPEVEFFVFDTIKYNVTPYSSVFKINSSELPIDIDDDSSRENSGHRPTLKGGYVPLFPQDSLHDMRSEMLTSMKKMGLCVEKHHHEVSPAQHELGLKFDTLLCTGDHVQIYKYIVHQVSNCYCKTATFMPKPISSTNGSGMHINMSIWKKDQPVFVGNQECGLSETCLYFIGGIIKHAKALNAFANPSTNSYKRLVSGYEAPVQLVYSTHNRSAACRIPFATHSKTKRIEIRFADPSANLYLTAAAMLMAGLDGIKNKIHPGKPIDRNIYNMPPDEIKNIPRVCNSLREALESLNNDREFLKKGNVFDDDQIDSFIELKMEEVIRLEMTPHPLEFEMYYSS